MAATDTQMPKKTSRAQLWAALAIAFLGWMFDGMEMGLYSWAMPQALSDLMGLGPTKIAQPLGVTIALFLAGMSLGGVVFGRLGDHIGRTKTLVVTVLMYAVFTGLSGFCHTFPQLAACRFLGAMGLGGEWGLGVALVMETWPNASRPLLAGLLGAAANVGFLIAGGTTMLLARYGEAWRAALGIGEDGQVWRLALVVGFLPAVLTFVIRLFVKEPERWVQSKERGERASFAELLAPALRRQTLMGIAVSAVAVLGMWGVYQAWLQAWVSGLVSEPLKQQGVAEAAITIATAKARASVTTWMAVGSIVGSLLGGPMAEWLGRRRSYAFLCIGSAIVSWLMYLTCDAYGPKLIAYAVVGGMFAASFFGWLPLYLPELFPTRIRATGEGLTFNAGRILSAVGVLVTGKLVGLFGGYPMASSVMACIWIVGLVLIWFSPETKGCDLPE